MNITPNSAYAAQAQSYTSNRPEESKDTSSSRETSPIQAAPSVSDRLVDAINPDRSFTVLSHGTKQGSDTENATINEIAHELNNEEYDDFIVLDGPGAKGKLPGSYAYNDLSKAISTDERLSTFGGKRVLGIPVGIGASKSLSRVSDLVSGTSAQHSAATAISKILAFQHDRGVPATINLIGFSRGAAVTSSHIVDKLKQLFGTRTAGDERPRLQINLFLIDPVAGGSLGLSDPHRLSQNLPTDNVHIESLFAMYSRDDEKTTYTPQYPSRLDLSDNVKTGFALLPGRHATLGLKNTSAYDPRGKRNTDNTSNDPRHKHLDGPSNLIKQYTLQFLADRHPSIIKEPRPQITRDNLVEEHDNILKDEIYKSTQQSHSKSIPDIAYSRLTNRCMPFIPRSGDPRISDPSTFADKLFTSPEQKEADENSDSDRK